MKMKIRLLHANPGTTNKIWPFPASTSHVQPELNGHGLPVDCLVVMGKVLDFLAIMNRV